MYPALVSLNVISKRMLSRREAAEHCGRSLKRFEVECQIAPIRFPNGDLRYDVRDLDKWLDTIKGETHDAGEIIAKLGRP